jgi:hypothetical protein
MDATKTRSQATEAAWLLFFFLFVARIAAATPKIRSIRLPRRRDVFVAGIRLRIDGARLRNGGLGAGIDRIRHVRLWNFRCWLARRRRAVLTRLHV